MLFFDDCNWGDHCAAVGNGCREKASGLGPVTVRTPRGLQVADWEEGVAAYQKRRDAARAN
jgi:magnesium-dependent phosphatase 1